MKRSWLGGFLALLLLLFVGGLMLQPAAGDPPSHVCDRNPDHPKCQSSTPTPTVTVTPTPTVTPTVTVPPGPWSCTEVGYGGTCGPYSYPGIVNSNGFNTYVSSDCWANPQCTSKVEANSPGDFQVTTNEEADNTGVRSYPNAQQLMNNWTGAGWGPCGSCGDTPISELASLVSTYSESFPHNSETIAQFAWDIWTNNNSGFPNEIMIWVDNVNRGNGGATLRGTATINGQQWTIYTYGDGELIWSLGAQGSYAQQSSGSVDILAILKESIRLGFTSPNAELAQVNAGWEVCSTGGVDETFKMTSYTLMGTAL